MLVLDRRTLAAKDVLAPRYADLVYEGRWWTTEREAMDAFVDVTQQRVTGDVTLRCYKGLGARGRPHERLRAVRRALRHVRRGRRVRAERRRRLHPPLRPVAARARAQGRRGGGAGARAARAPTAPRRADRERRRQVPAHADEAEADAAATARRPHSRRSRARPGRRTTARWPTRPPRACSGGRVAQRDGRGRAQALGRPVRRRPLAPARGDQPLHRRRLPPLAARRAAVQGVGGRVGPRRRADARREPRAGSAGSTSSGSASPTARSPRRATRTCTP
jgi:hypothetical protein